jgi:hypothetical protein
LGERLLCKQEVVGSIPSGSTKLRLVSPDDFIVCPSSRRRRCGRTGWLHQNFERLAPLDPLIAIRSCRHPAERSVRKHHTIRIGFGRSRDF